MTKKREFMEVDPEFKSLVQKIKQEMDFGSDRRTTKEIAYTLTKKKRKEILEL